MNLPLVLMTGFPLSLLVGMWLVLRPRPAHALRSRRCGWLAGGFTVAAWMLSLDGGAWWAWAGLCQLALIAAAGWWAWMPAEGGEDDGGDGDDDPGPTPPDWWPEFEQQLQHWQQQQPAQR